MIKYRAYIEVTGREDISETPVYLQAENRDTAKELIVSGITEKFNCQPEQVEIWNLTSEFENPEGVRDGVCGWEAGQPVAWDENPLILG